MRDKFLTQTELRLKGHPHFNELLFENGAFGPVFLSKGIKECFIDRNPIDRTYKLEMGGLKCIADLYNREVMDTGMPIEEVTFSTQRPFKKS